MNESKLNEYILNGGLLDGEIMTIPALSESFGVDQNEMDRLILKVQRNLIRSYGFETGKTKTLTAEERINLEVVKSLVRNETQLAEVDQILSDYRSQISEQEDPKEKRRLRREMQEYWTIKSKLASERTNLVLKLKVEDRQERKQRNVKESDGKKEFIIQFNNGKI